MTDSTKLSGIHFCVNLRKKLLKLKYTYGSNCKIYCKLQDCLTL